METYILIAIIIIGFIIGRKNIRIIKVQRKGAFGGRVYLVRKNETLTYRGDRISCAVYYFIEFVSPLTCRSYTTSETDQLWLDQLYVQYREIHNIPSPNRIKNIREAIGISSGELEEKYGLEPGKWEAFEDGVMPTLEENEILNKAIDEEVATLLREKGI